MDTKAFNELIKSDIGDPKKVKEAFDAIKALQKKLGVKEDGIVGSITFAKLSEEDKKKLGAPAEKAGDKKPEVPSEELKKMSEQFEKDKAAMKDLFGEDVVVDFEKILKKYTDFKKPFNEMVTDPEINELNVRCTRRVLEFMKTAKESGTLDHKLFTLSVIDKEKDIYSMKLKDTPSAFLKRYFNAKHPDSTYYFKWENGKFIDIKESDLPKKEAPKPEIKPAPKAPETKPESTEFIDDVAGLPSSLKARYDALTLNEKDTYRTYLKNSREAQQMVKNGTEVWGNKGMDMPASVYMEGGKYVWKIGRGPTRDSLRNSTTIANLNEFYLKGLEAKHPTPEQIEAKLKREASEKIKKVEELAKQWDGKEKWFSIKDVGLGIDYKSIVQIQPELRYHQDSEGRWNLEYAIDKKPVADRDAFIKDIVKYAKA